VLSTPETSRTRSDARRERRRGALEARAKPLTIVYDNPVCGAVLDASPALVRAAPDPPAHSTVVIWKDRRHAAGEAPLEAQRRIVVRDSISAFLEPLASPVEAG
jgi:hypothetical protein